MVSALDSGQSRFEHWLGVLTQCPSTLMSRIEHSYENYNFFYGLLRIAKIAKIRQKKNDLTRS